MISVRDAQIHVLSRVAAPVAPEVVSLTRGLGRVLSQDLRAPFDVPPADNSAVDGYAVTSADIPVDGARELEVVADVPAGAVYEAALRPGEAIRIMTGAPMPAGADTVIPLERVTRAGGRVRIPPLAKGSNVRLRGEDVSAGTVVIEAGAVLRPQELGIAPDDRDRLRAQILEASRSADVVITSGGVSVGDYDLVKEVLGELGTIDFWQVAMQPGRPLAAGRVGDAHFFGLPGNPVASMLTFALFVRPVLWKLGGRRQLSTRGFHARASEAMPKRRGRREFKRGVLSYQDDGWEVRTTGPQGSGIVSSMVAGNCLIVIEEDRGDVEPGDTVWVEPFADL